MNLVFDFDGTICDSFSKAVEIANSYLAKSGHKGVTKDELKNKGIKKLIEEKKLSFWQKLILVHTARKEAAKYIDSFNTFPGLSEVLGKLHEKNNLYILTSNSNSNVGRFLKRHNLDKYFNHIYSNRNLFGKDKVLKKIHANIYIGDETRDIEAAKKAGVKSVAVIWGYESKKLLKSSKPDFLVDKPEELLRLTLSIQSIFQKHKRKNNRRVKNPF